MKFTLHVKFDAQMNKKDWQGGNRANIKVQFSFWLYFGEVEIVINTHPNNENNKG